LHAGDICGLRAGDVRGLRDGDLRGLRDGDLRGLSDGDLGRTTNGDTISLIIGDLVTTGESFFAIGGLKRLVDEGCLLRFVPEEAIKGEVADEPSCS
jgi:hypothetical protein